jgi:hypothetical protein
VADVHSAQRVIRAVAAQRLIRAIAATVLASVASTGCATATATAVKAPGDAVEDRNYLVPALEIVGMSAATNLIGRTTRFAPDLRVSIGSIKRNLRGRWVIDHDPFEINQLLHPYQGATYHAMARSSGLNYWQAFGYAMAGSALWEVAGERTPPSMNDQIATGLAGPFLGEPLFRAARRILGPSTFRSGVLRSVAAAVVSPPTALNRALLGSRGAEGPEMDGLAFQLHVGLTADTRGGRAARTIGPAVGFLIDSVRGEGRAAPERPFDDFRLEGIFATRNVVTLSSSGAIAGKRYGSGNYRGIWGLYGGYDYFVLDRFRLSTTSVSLGTTAQWALSRQVSLRTAALLGLGYAAVQRTVPTQGATDYGVAPQSSAGLELMAGRRMTLAVSTRHYRLGDAGSQDPPSSVGRGAGDVIARGEATAVVRLVGRHGVGIRYAAPTVGLFYTVMGFGADGRRAVAR